MNSTKTKQPNPKLNVKLLRRVKRHILAEPNRFIMNTLAVFGKPGSSFYGDNYREQTFPKCGTAACIAGWTCALSGRRADEGGAQGAAVLLGIPYDNCISGGPGDKLFFTFNWPAELRDRYDKAESASDRAKIAAERIEHFIKTGE